MVSYEIYREDGGNGITFVHMLYIVKNIKFIYMSFDEFFLPVSHRVEMHYIFSDNVRILYLSCYFKSPKETVKLSKKSRNNPSLLFLLNAASLAEKQQIPILYSFVWPDRGSYPQYIALKASTLTIALLMWFPIFLFYFYFFNQNFLLSFNMLFENKN